jgi:hypothetical protein
MGKNLANHSGRTKIKLRDIRLACVFFSEKFEKKFNKISNKNFIPKIQEDMISDSILKRTKNNFNKKKGIFKLNNLKIV